MQIDRARGAGRRRSARRPESNTGLLVFGGLGAVGVVVVVLVLSRSKQTPPPPPPSTPTPAAAPNPAPPKGPREFSDEEKAALIGAAQVLEDPSKTTLDVKPEYQVVLDKMSKAGGTWPGLTSDLSDARTMLSIGRRNARELDRPNVLNAIIPYLVYLRAGDRKAAADALANARRVTDEETKR